MRRGLAATVVWAAALAGCPGPGREGTRKAESPPPVAAGNRLNVLLITIDTLRADHMGAYGYRRPTSPRLDALARRGVVFDQAYTYWPKTRGSFVGIMTGRFASQTGYGKSHPLLLDFNPTLASVLKGAGYETAATVDNPNVAASLGYARGFDRYRETWEESGLASEMDRTRAITADGVRYLAGAKPDRPFLLWLHYVNPHAPYEPPAPWDKAFLDAEASRGPRLRPVDGFHDGVPKQWAVPGKTLGWYVAQYDGEIAAVDAEVGSLVEALDASAVRDRTLVVVTSDHGESLGEHGYYFDHGFGNQRCAFKLNDGRGCIKPRLQRNSMVSNIAKDNSKNKVKKLSSFFTSMSPSQVLVLGFIVIVLLGGLVLSLPISNVDGRYMRYLDALFTATSATCVTGLVVVDTATNFTRFGQIVILILVQVGGLGFMAMATMIFLILGRRIGLRNRLLLQESYNKFSLSGLVRLTKMVMGLTFFIEGLGALFLFLRLKNFMPMGEAAFTGIFHSISAFCNAGFDVFGKLNGEFSSLSAYTTDGYIPIVIGLLIVVGGLGFPVLAEVISYGSNRNTHVSIHTRLVIKITTVLLIFGAVAILILEFTNPETLKGLPFVHKIINSVFTAITPRTAGFNTIPTGGLRESTSLVLMMLMFIGASPSSTGGGIKTVTAGVLMMSLVATIKGDDVVEYHERRIPRDQVLRATAVVLLAAFVVLVGTLAISLVESSSFLDIMFEVISAFATVGLSRGITPSLGPISRFIIIVIMLMGRLGPLTFAVALNYKKSMSKVKVTFPEEHVMIG